MNAPKVQTVADLINDKNAAYGERNKIVAALARFAHASGYTVGIGADKAEPDPLFRGVVFIDLPTGQVSWHFHRDETALFAELPAYLGGYDGHSTPEKYNRLLAHRPEAILEMAKNALVSVLTSKAHHLERSVATAAGNFMESVTHELALWAGRKK